MSDILRRSLAPVSADAWDEIDSTAKDILKAELTARTLVDFSGPHGLTYAAINTGRLEVAKKSAPGSVPWGLRQVQPLLELRIPFNLNQMELDSISRGSDDPDLEPLEQATRNLARFEERAIFNGFKEGKIEGIVPASAHKAIKLPNGADQYPNAVGSAVEALGHQGIGGPYTLVLGSKAYYPLMQAGKGGFPPSRIIKQLIQGDILWSPALDGGVLLSTRGGDFELTVGQDVAIGYASHDREQVELYLVESFTFRVLEPAAAVELKLGA
jgi:uncharacterized linocin/CFP29 family protein